MKGLPRCPDALPSNIGELVKKIGTLWAENEACPQIDADTKTAWGKVLMEWADGGSG